MGCDIIVHQEIKINRKWQHYRHVPRTDAKRNAWLFQQMVAVSEERVAQSKGNERTFPWDMSAVTRFDHRYWRNQAKLGHRKSCVSGTDRPMHVLDTLGLWEIKDIENRVIRFYGPIGSIYFYEYFGSCFGNAWDHHLDPENEPGRGIEDVRWIFWFVEFAGSL